MEAALQEREARLAADLDATMRLHAVSTRLIRHGDFGSLLEDILDAAVGIAGADLGTLRMIDPSSGELKIVTHRGFEQPFLEYFHHQHGRASVCGQAMERRERVIVEDVTQSPIFAGTEALTVLREAGVRSAVSTPLFSRTGQLMGLMSTFRHVPHRADDRVLRLMDLLARQAADAVERVQAEEALRRGLARFELLAMTAGDLLQAGKPQEAVESLCRRVMGYLDCHVFFNFLVDEKAGKLHLNACAGIPEEEARRIEWLEYGVAVCGCVARDGRCMVAQHIPTTPDERTELVKSYGVKAYACHPLQGRGGKVMGTLSFGTRGRETFSDEDLSLMRVVTDHVAMAMVRMKDEEALRASLAEKDVLLRELSHRTKNNMQVIVNLLGLQAAELGDANVVSVLMDAKDRIHAMALVHENLYRSGSVSSLSMKKYVEDLLASLLRAHQGNGGPVSPVMELGDISLSLDAAIPCGLIINELVSNSLKHAFPGGRSGGIFLSLRRAGDKIELRYRDDGPGLPRDIDLSRIKSLGLKLVYNLAVRQLHGTMDVRHDPVTEFVFRFGGLADMEQA